MSQTLSLNECAARLGCSRSFVDTMVSKGRLQPDKQGRIAATELEQLAQLLSKLRHGGIAAMVNAADQEL